MNRKQYLIFVIGLAVGGTALIVTNYIWHYFGTNGDIYPILIVLLLYMFLKYKLTAPMQMFTTKFSMLVDYDLDVEGAVEMCEKAYKDAPTKALGAIYQTYYGMALYYAGRYDEAVKILNTIELRRLNVVYHGLIFAFIAYCAYESDDRILFRQTLDRIKNILPQVPGKYQSFINGYIEIIDVLDEEGDVPLDKYKEVIEKNFTREDGYISTKLIYNYRMGIYYTRLGDELEADKCFAFVIANGKNHHTALQSKKRFKGLVKVEDFVYVLPTPGEAVETQTPEPVTPELPEKQEIEESENDKKEE
jgi:tetratricopeptide (TPR) repeat protein